MADALIVCYLCLIISYLVLIDRCLNPIQDGGIILSKVMTF